MRAPSPSLLVTCSVAIALALGNTVTASASTAPEPSVSTSPGPQPSESVAPEPPAAASGTIRIESPEVPIGEPLTITWEVNPASATNWIGLYRQPGGGPIDQEYVAPSLDYRYITTATGTVSFPTERLGAGDYVAYGLADDGYRWLAQPVEFSIFDDQPLHFASETIPLRNAWAHTGYRARVDGVVQGDITGLTFRKVSGPAWVRVGASGTIGGTPLDASRGRPAAATIEATNTAGETARATITVDVRKPSAELVPDVKVMTWNVWLGGSRVSDSREKELRFLLDSDVDIVGIQESSGTSAKELGDALGWDYYQAGSDLGIISRYPIVKRSPLPSESGLVAMSATVRLDARRKTDVTVWNTHLAYTPYGPYDACFGHLPVDQLIAKEQQAGRTQQITDILAAMDADLRRSDATPVLLTGDFNAPSHLDWSPRADRCGYDDGVLWPASVLPTDAGLVDTYRKVNRNSVSDPGITWSPIYKTFTGGYGYDSFAGQAEPQDRLDFVYAKGDWRVKDSATAVVGTPASQPDHALNEWTSDHAAVITEFTVR